MRILPFIVCALAVSVFAEGVSGAQALSADSAAASVTTAAAAAADSTVPFRVDKIRYHIGDAFDDSKYHTKYDKWAYDLLNVIHIETREATVRKLLLFNEGDVVDLNLMLMCNGNPRNILAYGDFKSGKGHYSLLPFNSLEGRFTNRFRELHIYNAVIDTPFGRVSTDAFSIVNSKLHLGKIILTDQDTGKNVTIREEDKVKPQDQHYNPEEKRDKPKKAKGKPKARRASS